MEDSKKMRCIRCKGRKKMYSFNGGWTFTNMGAIEKDCPLCLGIGFIKPLKEALKQASKIKKDFKNATEKMENSEKI
jgi:hypothetical protein